MDQQQWVTNLLILNPPPYICFYLITETKEHHAVQNCFLVEAQEHTHKISEFHLADKFFLRFNMKCCTLLKGSCLFGFSEQQVFGDSFNRWSCRRACREIRRTVWPNIRTERTTACGDIRWKKTQFSLYQRNIHWRSLPRPWRTHRDPCCRTNADRNNLINLKTLTMSVQLQK